MNKTNQLKILKGASTKIDILKALVRTHYNDEGWDTETCRDQARSLYNDLDDFMNLLRNETT